MLREFETGEKTDARRSAEPDTPWCVETPLRPPGGMTGTEPSDPGGGPSISYRGHVERQWIDINQHMNVAWYDHVFDVAETTFFRTFGITDEHIAKTGFSMFRLERLVRYERELLPGESIEVRSMIAWTDFKRVHHFHELWNTQSRCRAASVDALSIHVDLSTRKSAVMTRQENRLPLEELAARHAALAKPDGVLHRRRGHRQAS